MLVSFDHWFCKNWELPDYATWSSNRYHQWNVHSTTIDLCIRICGGPLLWNTMPVELTIAYTIYQPRYKTEMMSPRCTCLNVRSGFALPIYSLLYFSLVKHNGLKRWLHNEWLSKTVLCCVEGTKLHLGGCAVVEWSRSQPLDCVYWLFDVIKMTLLAEHCVSMGLPIDTIPCDQLNALCAHDDQ